MIELRDGLRVNNSNNKTLFIVGGAVVILFFAAAALLVYYFNGKNNITYAISLIYPAYITFLFRQGPASFFRSGC